MLLCAHLDQLLPYPLTRVHPGTRAEAICTEVCADRDDPAMPAGVGAPCRLRRSHAFVTRPSYNARAPDVSGLRHLRPRKGVPGCMGSAASGGRTSCAPNP